MGGGGGHTGPTSHWVEDRVKVEGSSMGYTLDQYHTALRQIEG